MRDSAMFWHGVCLYNSEHEKNGEKNETLHKYFNRLDRFFDRHFINPFAFCDDISKDYRMNHLNHKIQDILDWVSLVTVLMLTISPFILI